MSETPDEPWDQGWVEIGGSHDGDDVYVSVPHESSRARRLAWIVGGLALFLLLVVGTVALWAGRQVDPPGDPGAKVSIEVPEGSTVTDVANQLEDAGVITNSLVFRLYSRWKGLDAVQAGSYPSLAEDLAMGEVIAVLESGPAAPPPAATVTVAEGLRLTEVTERLDSVLRGFDPAQLAAAYAKASPRYRPPGVTSLEGLLFPDTYRIEQGDEKDEAKLVAQMVTRLEKVADELGYRDAKARTGLTPYEVITIASIIEREAKVPEDRPKVARVIYNRLAQGMPLEIDASLLYALGHKETLTESDLATPSPYNTRLNIGLPPTPIAMPGRASLEAAIDPPAGAWLYYVLADERGGHFFTDDYDEFLRVAQESRDKGLFE